MCGTGWRAGSDGGLQPCTRQRGGLARTSSVLHSIILGVEGPPSSTSTVSPRRVPRSQVPCCTSVGVHFYFAAWRKIILFLESNANASSPCWGGGGGGLRAPVLGETLTRRRQPCEGHPTSHVGPGRFCWSCFEGKRRVVLGWWWQLLGFTLCVKGLVLGFFSSEESHLLIFWAAFPSALPGGGRALEISIVAGGGRFEWFPSVNQIP